MISVINVVVVALIITTKRNNHTPKKYNYEGNGYCW